MPLLFHILLLMVFNTCMIPPPVVHDNVVVAHRGAWKKNGLPENSIAALRQAITLGCAGSEFDVRMTADDSLIVNHDAEYHGLPIEQTNYAELIAFPLANGEKLPTLREYVQAGLQNNDSTGLVCEIKPSDVSPERGKVIAEQAFRLVRQLGAQSRVTYISFDYDMLKTIVALDPTVPTQYLNGDKSPAQVRADGIQGIDYHFSVYRKQPEWVEQAQQNNLVLNAWTVNRAAVMDRLLTQGFDYITTNEPELLLDR